MGRAIFLGYRRADTSDAVGRVYDALCLAFGEREVFRDVDNMPIGSDFRAHIARLLPKCRVCLVFIGPDWLDARDTHGRRRLDEPDDLVRVEIETALATPKLLVVPVLVNGARMPSENELPESISALARRHAAIMRGDPDFRNDISRLADALRDNLRTGRLNLQSLGGAASVTANAAGFSMLFVITMLALTGAGVTAAVPELRAPVVSVLSSVFGSAATDHDVARADEEPALTTPQLAARSSETSPPPPTSVTTEQQAAEAEPEAARVATAPAQREETEAERLARFERWVAPIRDAIARARSSGIAGRWRDAYLPDCSTAYFDISYDGDAIRRRYVSRSSGDRDDGAHVVLSYEGDMITTGFVQADGHGGWEAIIVNVYWISGDTLWWRYNTDPLGPFVEPPRGDPYVRCP